jgi:hypothetical protein
MGAKMGALRVDMYPAEAIPFDDRQARKYWLISFRNATWYFLLLKSDAQSPEHVVVEREDVARPLRVQ